MTAISVAELALCGLWGCKYSAHSVSWPELLKTGLINFLFLHNYIQFSTVIRIMCFEKIFVGIQLMFLTPKVCIVETADNHLAKNRSQV